MAYFLRKLDRSKAAFHKCDWYCKEDVQGDALSGLRTQDNCLSIWWLEADHANLDRIIAALAATRQFRVKFDYAIIPQSNLGRLDVTLVQTKGTSCDDKANQNWHYELRRLTGTSLLRLANIIQNNGQCARRYEREVEQLIRDAIENGFIQLDCINSRLKLALGIEE